MLVQHELGVDIVWIDYTNAEEERGGGLYIDTLTKIVQLRQTPINYRQNKSHIITLSAQHKMNNQPMLGKIIALTFGLP